MNNNYNIDFDLLPRGARGRIDGIKQLLEIAYAMEYELLKVDYNSGMIRLEWGAVSINWYTTVFTLTVETPNKQNNKYPNQEHYKNCTFEKAKAIIENPLEFRKR